MLNRYNFLIAEMLPKDGEGVIGRGIFVGPGATIETDGHQLLMVSAPEVQPSLFPETDGIQPAESFNPFTLDRESALKISKYLPKDVESGGCSFAVIDSSTDGCTKATLAVSEAVREEIMRAKKITGTYPDVTRSIPDPDKAKFTISLNAVLLAEMLKQVERFTKDSQCPTVTLRVYSPTEGLRIDANEMGQHMVGVLMPLRQVEAEPWKPEPVQDIGKAISETLASGEMDGTVKELFGESAHVTVENGVTTINAKADETPSGKRK